VEAHMGHSTAACPTPEPASSRRVTSRSDWNRAAMEETLMDRSRPRVSRSSPAPARSASVQSLPAQGSVWGTHNEPRCSGFIFIRGRNFDTFCRDRTTFTDVLTARVCTRRLKVLP
jgi:hypothetical protein